MDMVSLHASCSRISRQLDSEGFLDLGYTLNVNSNLVQLWQYNKNKIKCYIVFKKRFITLTKWLLVALRQGPLWPSGEGVSL